MIRVDIANKVSQQITHSAKFETQELAQEWIDKQEAKDKKCPWGRPRHVIQVLRVDGNDDPILDENGDEQFDDFTVEAEYTISFTDITAQVQLAAGKEQYLQAEKFGKSLKADFVVENVMLGMTTDESELVLKRVSGVLFALDNGLLETCIERARRLSPTEYDGKYITEARLLQYVNRIEEYLGWEQSLELNPPEIG